ncbi:MAG: hypothetical protein AAGI23_01325 [Bacteroidota bacterium]
MKSITLIIYSLLFINLSAYAVQPDQQSLFDVFQEQDLLEVTLKTDFDLILADKRNEEYQPATFIYLNAADEEVLENIKIKQRGKYRRRVCDMPPLKLNFDKSDLADKGLAKFDKMKLVTYCMDSPSSKEAIVKEYLAYQMYQELTPYSYRTQLVKITYIDTDNPRRKTRHFGFLIESTSELEARIDAEEVEAFNLQANEFNLKQEALVANFQYMIGNADWDRVTMRNVKILKPTNGGKLLLVPYDFDFSGMVDANYAIPNTTLGLDSVQQRAYLGTRQDKKALIAIESYFVRKRDQLYEVIENCRYLNRVDRQEVINYLDTYYDASTIAR